MGRVAGEGLGRRRLELARAVLVEQTEKSIDAGRKMALSLGERAKEGSGRGDGSQQAILTAMEARVTLRAAERCEMLGLFCFASSGT
jgi:hypothetical protein